MANEFKKLIIATEENERRIKEGIEKNRKGDFTIKLDSRYAGTKVYIKLKAHKFKFGANIFMLDEFPDDGERKNSTYRKKFKEIFNLATLPFYWDATEPEEGKTRYHKGADDLYRRPAIDLCLEYCKENNIEPREHGLCYDFFYPSWVPDNAEELMRITEQRMEEISKKYAKDIPTIEVTNEILHAYRKRIKSILAQMPDYVERCYALAKKYFPKNQLCINESQDFVWQEKSEPDFYLMVKSLLEKNCAIDAIGAQFHMFKSKEEYFDQTRTYYNLSNMFRVLDLFAGLGKPIQITEITIPAYASDADSEEEQADILEKMYSLWFSHPAVEEIVYWNLVDGYAAFVEPGDMSGGENYYRGGLLRFDMSEKPAFKRLKKLIKEIWTTKEILTLRDDGTASFRGFYGEYEVVVEDGNEKKSFLATFEKDGQALSIN